MHLAMGFEKKGIDVNGPMPDGAKKCFEWCQKVPRSAVCGVRKRQVFVEFGPECARWCQILFFCDFCCPKLPAVLGGVEKNLVTEGRAVMHWMVRRKWCGSE